MNNDEWSKDVVRKPKPDTYYIVDYGSSYGISHYQGANDDGYWGYFYHLEIDGWDHESAQHYSVHYCGHKLGVPIIKEQYDAITGRVKKITKSIYRYAETHIEKQASTANDIRCYIDSNVLYKKVKEDIKECLVIDLWNLSYCDYPCFDLNPQYNTAQPISVKTYEHCKKRILNFARKQMDLCKSIIDSYDTNRRND